MTLAHALRLAAAATLAAAVGVITPAPPATAVGCEDGSGVTVVVDFSALGGGVAETCVVDGGGDTAAELFAVDHSLTRVQTYPGAVCRVDGAPSDLQCRAMPPESYYWALYWSDGTGDPTYSSEGVDALEVPDGGSVAFVFHKSDPPPSQDPSPSGNPSDGGASGGDSGTSGNGGDSGGTGGVTSSPSSGPSSVGPTNDQLVGGEDGDEDALGRAGDGPAVDRDTGRSKGGAKEEGDRQRKSGEDAVLPEPAPTSDDPADAVPGAVAPDASRGLPVWVAPTGIGVLFAAAGAVALIRRRHVV